MFGWRSTRRKSSSEEELIGTFLPFLAAVAYGYALGFEVMYEALAAGVSLAPTSVGISLKLLLATGQLQSHVGQAIITGAFVDDFLSLFASSHTACC